MKFSGKKRNLYPSSNFSPHIYCMIVHWPIRLLCCLIQVWARKYRGWAKPGLCIFATGHQDRGRRCWTLAHCLYIFRWKCLLIRWKSVWAARHRSWPRRGKHALKIPKQRICICLTNYYRLFLGFSTLRASNTQMQKLYHVGLAIPP